MDREELKAKIPYGCVAEIAEAAGVTTKTVYSFLNKKSNNHKVEMAILETVARIEKKKSELLSCIQ